MKHNIPFNKPFIVGKELFYISQSVLSGHTAGDGMFTKKCHTLMEEKFSALKVLLTHSCTAALEMAALLSNVGPGDEVILPSYTFVSTANAFYLRGAKLTFVDIMPDTLNIDVSKIERALTSQTRVIAPVHYAGIACEMDEIMEIANSKGIIVVEDAAQGVNAKYKGKYLGCIGHIGAYSFHETKNFISGEGGAIVLNDDRFIERAEIIREKGTNRNKFFRGEVDKYTWVDVGSSYLPSDILAAFLYAQLENMESINHQRREIYDRYTKGLMPLANDGRIRVPYIPKNCESNYHLFYIILEDEKTRNALMNYLRSKNILSVFHYIPLHLSPVGISMGYEVGDLPVTESFSGRLLRLPFYYNLAQDDQEQIVDCIYAFFNK